MSTQSNLPTGPIIPFLPDFTPTDTSVPLSPVPSIQSAWDAYVAHVRTYFYKPDIEAASITLAAAASHFHKNADPCWLFILGPSGGDKTSVCINSLLDLPEVHLKGELTAKTFLSGYTGTAHASLLHKIGSGILAFKDFTTFASKRPEEQAEISSQLREIYDGVFVKDTGKGILIKWEGKLTVIAAGTPNLEYAWATRRDLGERFLQVRISRKDGIKQAEYAQRQRGKEEFISRTMRDLAKAFFQATPSITNPPQPLSDIQMNRVAALSELVSHCRGVIPRDKLTGVINGEPVVENTGRMSKVLAGLISNHSALFRKPAIDERDISIGKRVALNTIPALRYLILRTVPINASINMDRIQAKLNLPESTVKLHVSDLEQLGILRIQRCEMVSNEISLSPLACSLWGQAFPAPLAS